MKKLIFSTFILICFFLNINIFASENKKNILILNSYHKGFEWSDNIIKGMEEQWSDKKIQNNILYLNSNKISNPQYYKSFSDLVSLEIQECKYDMIVAIDKFAYNFFLENANTLYTNQKIFYIGTEQLSQNNPQQNKLRKQTYGLIQERAVEDSISMANILMPNLEKIYIINDKIKKNNTDKKIHTYINKNYPDLEIEYLSKLNFEELKSNFSTYRKNEVGIFMRFYKDKNNKIIENEKIKSFISSSKIPIFITDTLFTNAGALGGKLIDLKYLGNTSAKLISNVLDNKIKTPSMDTLDEYTYLFDYEKKREYKINPLLLHEAFSYENSYLAIFENRSIVNFVFIILPFLCFLILALIHNLYLRIKNSKLLEQRIEFDKVLLDAIKSPIVWQDNKGNIVDSNAKFNDFLEMESSHLEYKKLKDFVFGKDAKGLISALYKVIPDKNHKKELHLTNKDGKSKIFLLNQTDYKEDVFNTSGTVTILTDITTEKEALKEKIKHQEFIIQQSKLAEIGEIFSSIAHQWKAPLVEISTIAQEHLYALGSKINEKNYQYVSDIMVQVKYMTNTVDDFQRFILPSTKKTVFNIEDSVIKMMEIVEHNIKYNYIDVDINVEENSTLLVLGYRNELMQTLLNVVNNSKQAILNQRKNKLIKNGKININIKNVNKNILIEIEDNGGGIPIENIQNLFNPYFTTKKDGHGIGLYMAKLIIEDKMNGKIAITNGTHGAKVSINLEVFNENISS